MGENAKLTEVQEIERLNNEPALKRWRGFAKYTGPAFMEAVTTLGAGSFASVSYTHLDVYKRQDNSGGLLIND